MTREYPRPRLVVSRCIEFDPCRYDGSKIPSPTVARLREYADCIPVCPEVEIGLGVPRATVRIVRIDGSDHLVQPATGRDVTMEMSAFAARFLDSLPPIDGFILKGCSPTSGTRNVRVYPSPEKSAAIAKSAGFFAREVLKRYPDLPVEDELRLNNARIRDHFLSGVFIMAAFRGIEATRDREALVQFHANNKLFLLASSQKMLREAGRLVANRAEVEPAELFLRYRRMLSAALARPPRYTGNVNVLLHTLGYFSDRISGEEKAYCIRLIDRYKNGHATLAEPRGLLRSWVIRFQEPYLMNQSFFAPYPVELVDLPGDVTDRGRNVWNSREDPAS
ncbi:YbgA family protein [Methanoculleus oceani]|uniref:DUF1722 domain-containing protein n=1 Tax=Methanoculleus oceani TaxID=2184756 RepID=A0ABD4TAE5_9EURY|nr:DUF523 and DUF1722 domain-containing protein [Methanoculleus sp. CWC-02]MCM2464900.1 DUF1722 domain-containing protein [Methanoculleus sp. CWC-02]